MRNEDKNMGQQPLEFRRRPLGVTAVWYMGGEGSGLDVASWIRRNNGTATFFATVPAWVSESGDAGFEEQPEHIAMETVDGFKRAHTDSWVAKDGNGQFHIVDSETFEREFVQTSFPEDVVTRYEALAKKLETRHTPNVEGVKFCTCGHSTSTHPMVDADDSCTNYECLSFKKNHVKED